MNKKISEILTQRPVFISGYIPYDYTKNMGLLAVQVHYTSGETQMLQTASTMSNVNNSKDFETDSEYFEFLEYMQRLGIPKLKAL